MTARQRGFAPAKPSGLWRLAGGRAGTAEGVHVGFPRGDVVGTLGECRGRCWRRIDEECLFSIFALNDVAKS